MTQELVHTVCALYTFSKIFIFSFVAIEATVGGMCMLFFRNAIATSCTDAVEHVLGIDALNHILLI